MIDEVEDKEKHERQRDMNFYLIHITILVLNTMESSRRFDFPLFSVAGAFLNFPK